MTNDKKHEDNDRKKVSDEEMEDVVGGLIAAVIIGRNAVTQPSEPGSLRPCQETGIGRENPTQG
ncbi:MAG: hypothetical protein VYD70_04005 [Planctomycetota bacterium]|nr:hypothetical protein [Planctomycetota bacterium]